MFSGRIFFSTRAIGPVNLDFFGPNRTRNEKNQPEKIMHGAVKFTGALIVILATLFILFYSIFTQRDNFLDF